MAKMFSSSTSYGQVIEYIEERLYLASYTHPPNARTPFPYPAEAKASPSKRSSVKQAASSPKSATNNPPVYFSIDDYLLYNAFHHDFGPLHIGHLYRFAVHLHDILGDPENEGRAVVFWSKSDSRSRANAACLLACYMVLIQQWPPHLALAPIAQIDPPVMPFRDAGYSQADYALAIQDVVYGVWKAKKEGLCGLREFSLEEYEKYERVDMGDFNWLTPSFLAFASPKSDIIEPIQKSSPEYASLPKNIADITTSPLSGPFKNVLSHFVSRNIGLVVRLNSELYCPTYFEALGIKHLDMIFEDGTCPALPIVKKFIDLAHEMINVKKRGIAVHCKAGLGRTGCLIGAYLIYRHGFTANEVIAFMRFMRPGMVVGPQQHWLHLNQGTFREWWWEDLQKEKTGGPSTPVKNLGVSKQRFDHSQTHTPPNGSSARRVLGEVDHNDGSAGQPTMDENLPAPTPGQPRKTSRAQHDRHHPYSRHTSSSFAEDQNSRPNTEVVQIHRESRPSNGSDESEEEWNLKMLRRTASRSPRASDKKRAATYTTTTMTSYTQRTSHSTGTDSFSDVENHVSDNTPTSQRPKTPKTNSGNGVNSLGVSKQRVSPRRSAESRGSVKDAGVRKASGRVASIGNVKTQRVSN